MLKLDGGVLCAALIGASAFSFATSASADGFPTRTYSQAPPFSWAGSYFGVNGGIGWNDQSTHVSGSGDAGKALVDIIFDKLNSPNSFQSQKQDAIGIIGGVQVGYNWQFGRWVLGIEADLQSANVKGDASTEGVFPGTTVTFRYTGDQDLQWFGTLRGRLGWANERILLFGTAGLAYGRTEASAKIADSNSAGATAFGGTPPITCAANVVCLAGASSETTIGWAAGFGFELALSRTVTFKTEYLRVDLGDQSVKLTTQSPSSGGGFVTAKFDNAFDIFRAGLNVRF
jgi:outer membrane immunogenic protein